MVVNLPMVSVAVITYNQAKTIGQTLDNILNQDFEYDFEIIIGEDCSTDNTNDICEQYRMKYPDKIKLISRQNNIGVIKNFSDTLMLCTGKYIAFCAGDDYWCDTKKLQKQVDYLEQNIGYGFIRTANFILIQKTGKFIFDNSYSTKIGYVFKDSMYGPVGAASTICFKRDLLRYIDFEEFSTRKFSVEDYPMQAILSKHTMFGYLPDITSVFRKYDGSESNPDNYEKKISYEDGIFSIKRYLSELYPNEFYYTEDMETYDKNYIRLKYAFERFDYKAAKKYKQELKNTPLKGKNTVFFSKNILFFYLGAIYKYILTRL